MVIFSRISPCFGEILTESGLKITELANLSQLVCHVSLFLFKRAHQNTEPETENSIKIAIWIRFDSIRSTPYSTRFDSAYFLKSIIRFDSIRLTLYSV